MYFASYRYFTAIKLLLQHTTHIKKKGNKVFFPLLLGTKLIFINKQQKQRILRYATHYKVFKTTKREITHVEHNLSEKWGNYCACTLQTISTRCCVKLNGIYAKQLSTISPKICIQNWSTIKLYVEFHLVIIFKKPKLSKSIYNVHCRVHNFMNNLQTHIRYKGYTCRSRFRRL